MTVPEFNPEEYKPFYMSLDWEENKKETKVDPYQKGFIQGFTRALIIIWKMNPNRGRFSPSDIRDGVGEFFETLGQKKAECVLDIIERIGPSVIFK
jgi:hypothetical protein